MGGGVVVTRRGKLLARGLRGRPRLVVFHLSLAPTDHRRERKRLPRTEAVSREPALRLSGIKWAVGSSYQPTRRPVVHDSPEYSPPSPARSFMSAHCRPDCSFSLWP